LDQATIALASASKSGHYALMRIDRIDHVQLAMPPGGEAAAVGFYEGLLGIAHVPKPAHLAERGGCWFEDGEVKVHLGVEQNFRAAKKAHPALHVTDLTTLVGVLRSGGVEVLDDEPLGGYDRVYAFDPFGNRIELMEPSHRTE
jgi:catechol 2,3-dioxygenase-like lactoylglutathione lyase family enzyme